MLDFVYNVPTKILFGKNSLNKLPENILKITNRILLVTGKGSIKKIGLYDNVTALLNENNIAFVELSGVDPNPKVTSAREGIKMYKDFRAGAILAVGGGSVIDCAKLIACGVFYDGDAWDFMTGKVKVRQAAPIFTVLTLSATGSEQNGNTVISNPETQDKLGLGSPLLRPVCSVLNPEFTYSVSKFQTAAGSADIMSHILEVYFNKEKNAEVQDRMAEALLKVTMKNAKIAIDNPCDYDARANLMWGGSLAIVGLLSSGKQSAAWSCHVLEHPVSAVFDISHGAGLAVITPVWMEYILSDTTVDKFFEYGTNVFGIDSTLDRYEVARRAIKATRDFFNSLGLPSRLSELGVTPDAIPIMAEKAYKDGLAYGYVPLTEQDAANIYSRAM